MQLDAGWGLSVSLITPVDGSKNGRRGNRDWEKHNEKIGKRIAIRGDP